MTKKVTWTSCNRLACANVTPAPTVVICITDSDLLAPITCEDETAYQPTTIEAVLTKSWKSATECQQTSWTYVFSYDEALLADPATALTSAQIDGVFCKGCLTTWVEDKIQCVAGGQGSVIPYYSNLCANTQTDADQTTALVTVPLPVTLFEECGQRIQFQLQGEFSIPVEDEATIQVMFQGANNNIVVGELTFESGISGRWTIDGYIGRGVINNPDANPCFGYRSTVQVFPEGGDITTTWFNENDNLLETEDTYNLIVFATVGSVDSNISMGQAVIDYYSVPVICEGEDCCD